MRPLVYRNHSLNWRVSHPKVIVAFGLMQESLVKHYSKFASSYVQDRLHEINPDIQVQVIPKATGQSVVDALMDRDTVGFIFISHSYKTKTTHSTIMMGADGMGIPSSILSAATPALRFISFLGCYGSTISKQYEIDYQLKKPFGFKVYYEPLDSILSTRLTLLDNVKRIIKKELKDMQSRLSPLDLIRGLEPDFADEGRLTIRVKDVYPQMEPRYVRVNDQVIGVLGSDVEHSNVDTNYRDLSFRVPAYAFQEFNLTDEEQVEVTQPDCHDVRIIGAELTPGVLVDNYLIESVILEGPFGLRQKEYNPPWHFGDQDSPALQEPPVQPPLKGCKRKRRKLEEDFLVKFIKYSEWIDRSPDTWSASPLKGRFYSDCF